MKKIKIILLSILILIPLFFGCKRQVPDGQVDVSGRFIGGGGKPLYFSIIHPKELEPLDSCTLNEEGSFKVRLPISQPQFIKVYTNDTNFIILATHPKENIYISGNYAQLDATYSILGSPSSETIHKYRAFTRENMNKLDHLTIFWENHKYDDNSLELKDSLDNEALSIFKAQRDSALSLINKNPDNFANVFIIYQYFVNQPLFDEVKDLEFYQWVLENLEKKYSNNEHIINLKMRINKVKAQIAERDSILSRLAIGKPAPDFALPLWQSDSDFVLSLNIGQPVLLHFFAGASLSSVKDIQKLKNILPQLTRKNVKIVTIFLDYDTETMKRAIEGEKINWTVCYDLSSLHSPVAQLYAVDILPMYYLIDDSGIIRDKAHHIDSIDVSSLNLSK
ncbi:MAG TPA: redoxin domain-containing protein [Bacteroidales bacterium]|nr:redoxin domain-containing protein [Bacteroidales bacterium]